MYLAFKFFAVLVRVKVFILAWRRLVRGPQLEYGRHATRLDFGVRGPGSVQLAEPDAQEGHGALLPAAAAAAAGGGGGGSAREEQSHDCSICMNTLRRPVILPCNHMFCEDCIGEWLQDHSSCPLCRLHLSPNADSLQAMPAAVTRGVSLGMPQIW